MSEDELPDRSTPAQPEHGPKVVLLVPRAHVKAVKLALEKHNLFDRYHGISPEESNASIPRMRMHTSIPYTNAYTGKNLNTREAPWPGELDLHAITPDITYTSWDPITSTKPPSTSQNPLRRALHEALKSLPASALNSLPASLDTLTATFPDAYSLYSPLLLLPSTSLPTPWVTLLHTNPKLLQPVWSSIATAMGCTHIALNAPIPPSNTPSSAPAYASDKENILRSPVNLVPLYGDFGSPATAQRLQEPTAEDFESALWVECVQNGVRQTWAPVYTMFSRGNVKEKARILNLPSLPLNRTPRNKRRKGTRNATRDSDRPSSPVHAADDEQETMAAVDMYAGIGYFSLPLSLSGCHPVLCWELNPWSIEALRRNCLLNKRTYRVFTPEDIPSPCATDAEWASWTTDVAQGGERVWIFHMSNAFAPQILRGLRGIIPPIRHVNLGLLPVSRLSWPAAVGAVSKRKGGWVHAHENVGVVEMEERRAEVEREFQRLVDECCGGRRREVKVEHVERVKMYAPGVVHAVFDVYIPGTEEGDE